MPVEATQISTYVDHFAVILYGSIDIGAASYVQISTFVNEQQEPLNWEIQWFESSSCGVRSGECRPLDMA